MSRRITGDAPTVEHKGHKIVYQESVDKWICGDLNIEAPSLSIVKRRIDEIGKGDRTVNVKALMIDLDRWSSNNGKVTEVTVTTLCEPDKYGDHSTRECWITYGKKQRSKVNIRDIIDVSAKLQIEEYLAAKAQADAAEKAAELLGKKLPRHTEASLKAAAKTKVSA